MSDKNIWRPAQLVVLWVTVLAFILDRGTKAWIQTNIIPYDHSSYITVVEDVFRIVHVHNEGAAFSFLAEYPGWQQWMFGILAVAVSLFLVFLIIKSKPGDKMLRVSYAMVIGGALGNLYDRIVYRYVVDFLDFSLPWGGMAHHYPSFNVADSFICVGVFLILLIEIFRKNPQESK